MQAAKPASTLCDIPPFQAPFAPPDETLAGALLAAAPRPGEAEARIDARATRLVEAIRARSGGLGGVEDFLHAYALSTKEGLALMVLAEALLRVPDAETADALIEDKLKGGDWTHHDVRSTALFVSASAWTLGITARVIHPGETPHGIIEALVKRLGLPAVRAATRQAMRLLGSHFVLGRTIGEALDRARAGAEYLYSFDMLGEGARTAADAERYFDAYAGAIEAIGRSAGNEALPKRPGISVKLSALHPRFEPLSRPRVLDELVPRLIDLARVAKSYALNFTVDAEEADRLELSLDVIGAALRDPSLAGWDGFGLAVQAYQKRAGDVIDWIADVAQALQRRLMVRLVKGAYWDTEIKRAQERGLADYPVFTRKAMTDLCYADCVRRLLTARPRLYPQFATHNALTVASVIEDAGGGGDYEFQRLHGMGEALYHELLQNCRRSPAASMRRWAAMPTCSPIWCGGCWRMAPIRLSCPWQPTEACRSPTSSSGRKAGSPMRTHARHPHIALPRDLFVPQRTNSRGVEFGDRAALEALLERDPGATAKVYAAPLIGGVTVEGQAREVLSRRSTAASSARCRRRTKGSWAPR